MPYLAEMLHGDGEWHTALAQMPTLTNVNNSCTMTGVAAAAHGISGNCYLAPDGHQRPLNEATALRADTILACAREEGIQVLAVTAKDKLRSLLGAGGVTSVSAERADQLDLKELDGRPATALVGPNPNIYDPALSPYTVDLALRLAYELGARLVYCSLTDYVQHKAPPGSPLAHAYCAAIDTRLGAALSDGWVIGLIADHGMNDKMLNGRPNVRYLTDILHAAHVENAEVVLPITDPYVRHHGALGSAAYVYLPPDTREAAATTLASIDGIEAVIDRADAAARYELPADRIGDLLVLADQHTALGARESDHDLDGLDQFLRSHGGLHERQVPLIVSRGLAAGPDPKGLRTADLFAALLGG
jgi:phosphonoacetate hydrolase